MRFFPCSVVAVLKSLMSMKKTFAMQARDLKQLKRGSARDSSRPLSGSHGTKGVVHHKSSITVVYPWKQDFRFQGSFCDPCWGNMTLHLKLQLNIAGLKRGIFFVMQFDSAQKLSTICIS